VRWTKAHLNIFSLSKVSHHKVLDKGFRVSATTPDSSPSDSALVIAPASNPRGSAFVTEHASNPSDNSSTILITLWLSFLPVVILNEGGVGP
jgi:hypothetical protein